MSTPAAGSTTGRYLVLFHEGARAAAAAALAEAAGLDVASSRDWRDSALDATELADEHAVVLEELGVAVVAAAPDRRPVLAGAADREQSIVALEPERRVRALEHAPRQIVAEARTTWGLDATGVAQSALSGRAVRVAVLDTGFAAHHPDFARRSVHRRSFVARETADDGHGHGTHCVGTACGAREPGRAPRYGIAYEAEIWAGKVLDDTGSGADGGILGGLNWAVANGCRVASMSLGAPVEPGDGYSTVFEAAARRARVRRTLVVAAAGNDSDRDGGIVRPVGHPANCPSILAVGALAQDLTVAPFSNGGLVENGGQVDFAAPGVGVLSAWPPDTYETLDGTSMATPHVAGIVALAAQAHPQAGAADVLARLAAAARRLTAPAADVGAGLIHVPPAA
jgi:subtilisin family serine protease